MIPLLSINKYSIYCYNRLLYYQQSGKYHYNSYKIKEIITHNSNKYNIFYYIYVKKSLAPKNIQ